MHEKICPARIGAGSLRAAGGAGILTAFAAGALLLLVGCSAAPSPGSMKRKPPSKVLPVVMKEQRFEPMTERPGVIKITEVSTGRSRELVVYRQTVKPFLEKDVQVRFITRLRTTGTTLVVDVEGGRRYRVNVDTGRVTEIFSNGMGR